MSSVCGWSGSKENHLVISSSALIRTILDIAITCIASATICREAFHSLHVILLRYYCINFWDEREIIFCRPFYIWYRQIAEDWQSKVWCREVGLDDLCRFLPTQSVLWCYDIQVETNEKWAVWLNTPSASFQMIPSCVIWSTHCMERMASSRTLTGAIWTSWSSTTPSARSCTWVGPVSNMDTGWVVSGLREALWRGLGDTGAWKTGPEPAMCTQSPESKSYLGLHQKKHDQQVKGSDSHHPLHSGETSSGVLHSAMWPPA